MLINTKKEADEWFEHNPADKVIHIVLLSEDDISNEDIDIESLCVLKTEENPDID